MQLTERLAQRRAERDQAAEQVRVWTLKAEQLHGAVVELEMQLQELQAPVGPNLSRHAVIAEVARLQKRAERRTRKRSAA